MTGSSTGKTSGKQVKQKKWRHLFHHNLSSLFPAIHCRSPDASADLSGAEGGQRGLAGGPAGDVPGPQGDEGGQRPELHRQEPDQLKLRAGEEEEEQGQLRHTFHDQ